MREAVIFCLYTGNEELVILTSQCIELRKWTEFHFFKCYFIGVIHACDFGSQMHRTSSRLRIPFSHTHPFLSPAARNFCSFKLLVLEQCPCFFVVVVLRLYLFI